MNNKFIDAIDFENDLVVDYENSIFSSHSETDILLREEAKLLANLYKNKLSKSQKSNSIDNNIQTVENNMKEYFEKNVQILEEIRNEITAKMNSKEQDQDLVSSHFANKVNEQNELFKNHENKIQDIDLKLNKKINDFEKNLFLINQNFANEQNSLKNQINSELNNKINTSFKSMEEKGNKKYFEISEKFFALRTEIMETLNSSVKLNADIVRDVSSFFSKEIDVLKNSHFGFNEELKKIYDAWNNSDKKISSFEKHISYLLDKYTSLQDNSNLAIEKMEKNQLKISQDVFSLNEFKEKLTNSIHENLLKIEHLNSQVDEIKEQTNSSIEKINTIDSDLFDFKEEVLKDFDEVNKTSSLILDYIENGKIISNLINSKEFNDKIDTTISSNAEKTHENLKELENKLNTLTYETNNLVKDVHHLSSHDFNRELNDFIKNTDFNINAQVDSSKKEMLNEIKNLEDSLVDKISSVKSQVDTNAINLTKLEAFINSEDMDKIIFDKLILIIEERVQNIETKILEVQDKLTQDIQDFVENKILDKDKEIVNSHAKIKNEALNVIYNELNKFENKISTFSEEIVKNYDFLVMNSRALNTLENLLNEQLNRSLDFDDDKKEIINNLILKIEHHKNLIENIRDQVNESLEKNNILDDVVENLNKQSNVNLLEDEFTYQSIRDLTLTLVKEEISKLGFNLRREEIKNKKSPSFFDLKIKELLGELMITKNEYDLDIHSESKNSPTINLDNKSFDFQETDLASEDLFVDDNDDIFKEEEVTDV